MAYSLSAYDYEDGEEYDVNSQFREKDKYADAPVVKTPRYETEELKLEVKTASRERCYVLQEYVQDTMARIRIQIEGARADAAVKNKYAPRDWWVAVNYALRAWGTVDQAIARRLSILKREEHERNQAENNTLIQFVKAAIVTLPPKTVSKLVALSGMPDSMFDKITEFGADD